MPGVVLPLRGRPGTDLSTLKVLLRATRDRGCEDGRLHGFAAPPTPHAVARAHLLAGLAAMLLGLLWPVGSGLILLGLAASQLSRVLGGPGLRLASGRPCWSLLLRPSSKPPNRIVVARLDRPRELPRMGQAAAAWLVLAVLVPTFPSIALPVLAAGLAGVFVATWLDRPPAADTHAEEYWRLEVLVELAQLQPKETWILASGAGEHGLFAVTDWWNREGKVQLLQVGGEPLRPGLPVLVRLPGETPAAAAQRLLAAT